MRNSQRYRLKAAECLAAAKLCQGDYRGLLVSIAVFWQWLAKPDKCWSSDRFHRPAARYGGVTHFFPGGASATRSALSSWSLANAALATTGGLSPAQITPGEGLVEGNGMRARCCGLA
jgi:hypothetical protein